MLINTNYVIDIDPLLNELENVKWDDKNRSNINRPTGHWLYDSYEISDEWKNTEFEKLLLNFPWPVGEARLMKLDPGTCYRGHADVDDRYHLNLISNEHCHLIDLEENKMYPLLPDGYFYRMNAGKIHTAVNFGSTSRIQLVIRIPLECVETSTMIKMLIKCKEPSYDFRYQFDKFVSPVINKLIKDKTIGWFNPISDSEMSIKIEQNNAQEFLNFLNSTGLKFLSLVE